MIDVFFVEVKCIHERIITMAKSDVEKLKDLQEHYLTKEEIDVFLYIKICLINKWFIAPNVYELFTGIYKKYENVD